eukprot:4556580-Amphidinium_carterae.2
MEDGEVKRTKRGKHAFVPPAATRCFQEWAKWNQEKRGGNFCVLDGRCSVPIFDAAKSGMKLPRRGTSPIT